MCCLLGRIQTGHPLDTTQKKKKDKPQPTASNRSCRMQHPATGRPAPPQPRSTLAPIRLTSDRKGLAHTRPACPKTRKVIGHFFRAAFYFYMFLCARIRAGVQDQRKRQNAAGRVLVLFLVLLLCSHLLTRLRRVLAWATTTTLLPALMSGTISDSQYSIT